MEQKIMKGRQGLVHTWGLSDTHAHLTEKNNDNDGSIERVKKKGGSTYRLLDGPRVAGVVLNSRDIKEHRGLDDGQVNEMPVIELVDSEHFKIIGPASGLCEGGTGHRVLVNQGLD